MYLPTSDPRQRKDITDEFFHYRRLTQSQLWDKYSAFEHWAKIEVCEHLHFIKTEYRIPSSSTLLLMPVVYIYCIGSER